MKKIRPSYRKTKEWKTIQKNFPEIKRMEKKLSSLLRKTKRKTRKKLEKTISDMQSTYIQIGVLYGMQIGKSKPLHSES